MRIPSGVTDQYIYFVAVDATDLKTRETGLSGFTVYRSRNGGTAVAFTTPTVNETDTTNMPGVYELLLDEDMTIDAGDDSQEVCLHITHASMAPVTRTYELYRRSVTSGETLGVSSAIANVNVTQWRTGIPNSLVGARVDVSVSAFDGTAGTFAAGRPEVNTTHVSGTAQTARDLGANIDTTISSRLATVGYTAPDNATITAINAKTTNLPSDPADASDIVALIDALPTAAENAAAVLAATVETGATVVQSLRLANSALGGKVSGLGTTNPKFRNLADAKDVIDATVDADGNRSAVTRDLT